MMWIKNKWSLFFDDQEEDSKSFDKDLSKENLDSQILKFSFGKEWICKISQVRVKFVEFINSKTVEFYSKINNAKFKYNEIKQLKQEINSLLEWYKFNHNGF